MVEIGDQTLLNHHSHAMLSTIKTKQNKIASCQVYFLAESFPSTKLQRPKLRATSRCTAAKSYADE